MKSPVINVGRNPKKTSGEDIKLLKTDLDKIKAIK